MWEYIINGFATAFQPAILLAVAAGVIAGGWFGAMPGLTATMAMAILVPFTYFMEPLIGIPFLLGVYKGGIWGGSIPAILINVPGTGAAVATTIDGYPMAKNGFAKKALLAALIASFSGELISSLWVMFIMEPLSRVALLFGAADLFSLIFASLVVMATVSEGTFIKGLASLGIGLWLAGIGMDPAFGVSRFDFGFLQLIEGFHFVPVVIGLFAFSEVLGAVINRKNIALSKSIATDWGPGIKKKDLVAIVPPILKGTVIGTIIGMIPAVGQPVAAFLGYGVEKKTNRHPEKFGTGVIEGVAAPEAANNAVNGGAIIPMLTFGIPGDVVTAVLLGAFIVQGLRPGPFLMVEHAEMMYSIFAIKIVACFVMLVVGRILIEPLSKIVLIPRNYLLPVLIVFCFVGTFAIQNSMFDVFTGLLFGVFGFYLKKYKFNVGTIAISFLLGKVLEKYLFQALSISHGDWSVFITRPISLVFLIIALTMITTSVVYYFKNKSKIESGAAG